MRSVYDFTDGRVEPDPHGYASFEPVYGKGLGCGAGDGAGCGDSIAVTTAFDTCLYTVDDGSSGSDYGFGCGRGVGCGATPVVGYGIGTVGTYWCDGKGADYNQQPWGHTWIW